ncbi:uncharacterized protein LOC124680965 [Lolium rigidum]|uniref:uncharacterized protein LOC124680965 n=1 Tax=Lolium rigidum TaxID=89674 RepID=UPI001F5D7512|nr:uncharacterized protein LOC124680965 [Lolium rigidum]
MLVSRPNRREPAFERRLPLRPRVVFRRQRTWSLEVCALWCCRMAEPDKGVPQVGMVFKDREEAWLFWLAYGGRVGFDVRKRYANKSPMDGKITSCRYVCSKEGLRKKGQRESIQKCFRAETRTECPAFMSLTLNRVSGNFEVREVDLQHNHLLYLPQTRHLMVSQRKISDFQAFEIEASDDSGRDGLEKHAKGAYWTSKEGMW